MPTAVEHGGAVDILLKVTGVKSGVIKGESQIAGHVGEIDIETYRWNVLQGFDVATGQATGRRQHKPLILTFQTCVASPILYAACCRNEVLSKVVMTCRKAGGKQQDYMIWTLTNASIREIKAGYFDHVPAQAAAAAAQPVIPYDEMSLVYQKIELDYKPQTKDGTLGAGVSFMDDWSLAYS